MNYEIIFDSDFVKSIKNLDNTIKEAVEKRIKKIAETPLLGKPLHGRAHVFSERILQYRIIYCVQNDKIIMLKFGKRDNKSLYGNI